MSKETKNGLKALIIGWLVLILLLGLAFLMVSFPTVGAIVLVAFGVGVMSILFFLFGTSF